MGSIVFGMSCTTTTFQAAILIPSRDESIMARWRISINAVDSELVYARCNSWCIFGERYWANECWYDAKRFIVRPDWSRLADGGSLANRSYKLHQSEGIWAS